MQRVPQLGVIAALAIVATLGFRGALDGWGFLAPAATGATVGVIALLVARRQRLYVGESIALSTVLFTAAGVVATLGSYPAFFRGLTGGWAHLLSSMPPATLTPELRVLPYAVAWGAVMIGGELSRRATQPILPIIGPLAAMVITALISPESSNVALVQGVALATGALSLGLLHQWLVVEPLEGEQTAGTRSRRASAMGLTALIALLAPLLGPGLPLADAHERFDLRTYQERPWDPLAEPSPLVTLKASLKEGRADDVVFTVESEQPLLRWTSAILASYNGTVWAVANEGPDAPAEFSPVDRVVPSEPMGSDVQVSDAVSYRIEFAEPTLWVPVVGRALDVSSPAELRVNQETGTIAAPWRLAAGDRIEIMSVAANEPAPLDLLATDVPIDEGAALELVPPRMRNLAGDIFEGIDPGPARVLALADRLTQQGFYDHTEAARPGHNLARLDEFLADPDRLVGYSEQYAASAAVLSQLGGLPTRVAVGYQIPADRWVDGSASVLADDISAWIEVRTSDYGWVPIDVTPDRAREPQDEILGVTITDVAIPNPPPPPPPPPVNQAASRPDVDDGQDDEPDENDDPGDNGFVAAIPTAALVGGAAIGLPTALLGLLASVVIVAKNRRRSKRKQGSAGERVQGAWSELTDGYSEAGVAMSNVRTPGEVVASLIMAEPSAGVVADDLRALAEQVDRAAFHPSGPTDTAASDAWDRCDTALTALQSSRTRWQRLAMRTDPRPLLNREPTARPAAKPVRTARHLEEQQRT